MSILYCPDCQSYHHCLKKDWERLNRVFKTTSDKTIDQDIEIERLQVEVEKLKAEIGRLKNEWV